MRKLFFTLLCASLSGALYADGLTTAGDGTTYTLATLAQTEGSDIEVSNVDGTTTYTIQSDITIAEGDKFVMDNDVTMRLSPNVTFTINGEADFRLTTSSSIGTGEQISTLGSAIRINSATTTEFENCLFNMVGLEVAGEGAVNVRNCQFYNHDDSKAAALYFISAGAESTVEYCHFENCQKAAIGSAANASQPLTIKGCNFLKNSLANNNIPQINITASNKLCIEDCGIYGKPELNMVGGIGISNFMGYDADIEIKNCKIQDNRYGIGLVGPANKILIGGCTLKNNCYETNPMNGGSGISLYDPYMLTNARIMGNHIEGSLWGVTIIGCKDVNLGRIDVPEDDEAYNPGQNVFIDNGNNGVLYDLYNNSANTVYAQGNTWNVSEQTEEQIESVIYHQYDDASLGQVIFMPAAVVTGIKENEALGVEDLNPYYYDLQGRRVDKHQNGKRKIVIQKNGNRKVFIR